MRRLAPTAKQNFTRRSTSSILSCKPTYRRRKNSAKLLNVRYRSKPTYLRRRPRPLQRRPEHSSRGTGPLATPFELKGGREGPPLVLPRCGIERGPDRAEVCAA